MKRKVTYKESTEIIRQFNKILDQRSKLNTVLMKYLTDPEKLHIYRRLKVVFAALQPVYNLRKEKFNNTEFDPFNK